MTKNLSQANSTFYSKELLKTKTIEIRFLSQITDSIISVNNKYSKYDLRWLAVSRRGFLNMLRWCQH